MDKKIIARVTELTKSDIVGADVQAVLDELKRLESKVESLEAEPKKINVMGVAMTFEEAASIPKDPANSEGDLVWSEDMTFQLPSAEK